MQTSFDTVQGNSNDTKFSARKNSVLPEGLGSKSFQRDYGIKYSYLSGAMYKGIASTDLVIAMGKAGLMGYLGAGGLRMGDLENAILTIKSALNNNESYGINLLCNTDHPDVEMRTIELFLEHSVKFIEAAAFMRVTPSLVRFRLSGLKKTADGKIVAAHKILAKISRPEVAEGFMRPAPQKIVDKLLAAGHITSEQAELAKLIPVAQDICVEADSGGHTDQGNPYVLMPAIQKLRDRIIAEQGYREEIRVGAAGGIGTPQSAAAAFMMRADFIMTGSINQCTVEAGTSDTVKDILQEINVQDTGYAPAGDMFELGAKVQVVKQGLLFATRANKLYDLYMRHDGLDDLDERTSLQIQEKYFKKSFDDVWEETKAYYRRVDPSKVDENKINPKQKMALIFRWYFVHSTRLAMNGDSEQKVDYQIHCGPALGAFNQWVRDTELNSWRNRKVADIAEKIMCETAATISLFISEINE
ncbi:PfaD family polyunsaturated fatty acid/polyketide biosynthesis protein [Cellvibrio sp. QJXJ]|uniref:PfaD family polyunsaturated fatty acid/polyketide biosynthesis protein n=1 Tax=Cellvibrio sp. QJXJ TaxID=2964606 RepID=UPI0021C27F0F|nr:PfaD family polyunsaturated fatty acid/polyketide biosynthesis protein [Cellvibrio sp. QJXJ]UUA73390.1 PfaD family polyunsaturated fatty acid/polyketide biosynthesis protein [Cellvibrio sp. QJXJ]